MDLEFIHTFQILWPLLLISAVKPGDIYNIDFFFLFYSVIEQSTENKKFALNQTIFRTGGEGEK